MSRPDRGDGRPSGVGWLIGLGLAVQGGSLFSATPGAFLAFAGLGCGLVGLGMLLFVRDLFFRS